MRRGLSAPGPLPCAIVLAAFIALTVSRDGASPPPGATPDDRTDDVVTGIVGGPLVTTPRGLGAPLHAGATTVWVWTTVAIEPGQRIAVTGRLRTPRGFLDPGAPDRAIVTASRGAEWELSAARVEILADDPRWPARAWRWAARMQANLAGQLRAGDGASGALTGIVTGDRTGIPPELDARWRAVGIYHVLSVSGLHLAVIAGLAFALLRRLVAASWLGGRTRPARWAAPAALVLAVAYTLVTGAQLATLRALLVVAIMLIGQMLDRPVRLIDALGAAAIVILVWRPRDLYDPSFQLSFVAALTLALLPAAEARGGRVRRWLVRGLVTSAWVTVATAPLTALHFHQIAAGGVIGNLVLTPIIELAALPLGLAGALVGMLPGVGSLGAPLVAIAVWLVARVDDLAGLLARGMPVAHIAIGSPLLVAVLVTIALWLCSRRQRTRADVVGWIVLCTAWAIAPVTPPLGALRVTFLDVGQGDAAIVELPGGTVWLVDAGGQASASELTTATAPGQMIARTLAVFGRSRIDLAIISHPHPDHYLGLAGLPVSVGELWFAVEDVQPGGAASFGTIVAQLRARGTRIGTPHALRTDDGVTLRVLAPHFEDRVAPDPVRTVNDNSLVIAIEYGGRTILFAGDLEAEGEEALVAAGLPGADVVKVAHHGSRTSSSDGFVAATHPALAVISCGVANAFGFPADEVVDRWHAIGASVARTDLDGAVSVTIGAGGDLVVDRYAHRTP